MALSYQPQDSDDDTFFTSMHVSLLSLQSLRNNKLLHHANKKHVLKNILNKRHNES